MLPDGTAPDAFMAYELFPLVKRRRIPSFCTSLSLPEADNAGYEKFHKEFMSKNYQGKLMLRPLLDADISFLKMAPYATHC